MDRLISIFDRHQNGTVISELNREGRLQDPAPEMFDVMSRVQDIYRLSKGAFDPTVLPLLLLVEERFQKKGVPPSDQEMKAAEALVDFGAIQVGPRRITLKSKEQKISLDGLAKGYIVDCTGKAIKDAGINNALINAGGDILAIGRSHRGTPWRVAIQDPFRADKYLRILNMTDQAVATSGTYEIFYDREQNFHHLMDPLHGGPAKGLVSSTSVAKTAVTADAMSTAIFVDPGLLNSTGTDGMIVARNGKQSLTEGFRSQVARL